jgi:hypothetical protein
MEKIVQIARMISQIQTDPVVAYMKTRPGDDVTMMHESWLNGLGFAELLCESPSFARIFAKKARAIILR